MQPGEDAPPGVSQHSGDESYEDEFEVAKRDVIRIYGSGATAIQDIPCLICGHRGATQAHHLDERGLRRLESQHVVNLVPLCANHNWLLQRSKAANTQRDPLITSDGLIAVALVKQSAGDLLGTYTATRLSAFVAATHEEDPKDADADSALLNNARCLFPLRGLNPSIALPFACDTLKRGVFPYLMAKSGFRRQILPRTLFVLSKSVGAIHRDYGDLDCADAYLELAERFSCAVSPGHRNSPEFTRFEFDRYLSGVLRAMQEGRDELPPAPASYEKTQHQELNVLQWDWLWQVHKAERSVKHRALLDSVRRGMAKTARSKLKQQSGIPRDFSTAQASPAGNSFISEWMWQGLLTLRAAVEPDESKALAIAKEACFLCVAGQRAPIAIATPHRFRQLADQLADDRAVARLEWRDPSLLARGQRIAPAAPEVTWSALSAILLRDIQELATVLPHGGPEGTRRSVELPSESSHGASQGGPDGG
jgi:hypothetical protein